MMNGRDKTHPGGAGENLDGGADATQEASSKYDGRAIERRVDVRLAKMIELGLRIDSAMGRKAAESFLWNNLAPYHVCVRVLSCTAFRRKSRGA